MEIAILLATYNSEKYLKTQIDSILSQDYNGYKLYIRDDGSTDSTVFIINEYSRQFTNIFVLQDRITHRKPMGSFMWMLDKVESDYYMFCDHDDFWLPNKISLTLEKMIYTETLYPKIPVIIHTDLKVVNSDLQEISNSFWRYSKIRPDILLGFNYLAVYNGITGCTMMINRNARSVSLPMNCWGTMHDAWIALKVVDSGGVIDYISKSTILYRQHYDNVVGVKEVGTLSFYFNKIMMLNKSFISNKLRLKMVQEIKSFSVFKYLFYKLMYTFKR